MTGTMNITNEELQAAVSLATGILASQERPSPSTVVYSWLLQLAQAELQRREAVPVDVAEVIEGIEALLTYYNDEDFHRTERKILLGAIAALEQQKPVEQPASMELPREWESH